MRRFFALFATGLVGLTAAQTIDPGQLGPMFKLQEQAERDETLALAFAYGLPIRQVLPNGTIIELAKFWHGRPLYRTTANVNAAITTRANLVHPGGSAGLSLTGNGLVLGIWDGGAVRASHQEFGGRVTVVDAVGVADHATHVGGTMIASGAYSPAKGMAWGSTLRSYDWNSDNSEMANAAANFGMVASNHSYSYLAGWSGNYWYGDRVAGHTEEAGFGYYDYSAMSWDQIVYSNPYYSVFKSAGNDRGEGPASQPVTHKEWSGSSWIDVTTVRPKDGGTTGYDTLPFNSVAKNVIVVGSVGDVPSYTSPSSVVMTSYSGWGPTDDGRIKPDLVANGESLTSSTSGNDAAYGNMSGTSMSSPNACGSAALVIQHFKNLNGGSNPFNYFLRGLLIHTADECGTASGPDYKFGWGLMNVQAACALLTDNASGANQSSRARMEVKSNGTTVDRRFTHTGGPIKVTICWNDAPSSPPAWMVNPTTKMLLADLDVRLIHVGTGTTYYPWVLDPANPANAATTGDNSRDNVEQIYLASPSSGDYIVRVTNKGTLSANVNYCLLTDSLRASTPGVQSFTLSQASVTGGNPVTASATLDSAPESNVSVALTADGSAVVTPANISISAGQTTGSTSLNTTTVQTTWSGTVTATLGQSTRTASLQVVPSVVLQSLSLDKSTMIAGATTLNGTVTLSAVAQGDTVVTVSDDSPNLTTPSSVTVTSGSSTKTFAISSTSVSAEATATVTALLNGVTKTASVTLKPTDLVSLSISPAVVTGGQSASATVTMDAASDTIVNVSLTSNGAAINGATIQVQPGQTTGSVDLSTNPVQTTWSGTVTATLRSTTKTATLEVRPALVLESFGLDKAVIISGAASLSGTVSTNVNALADISISIADDSPNLITPASINLAGGTSTKSFGIDSTSVSSEITATVSATLSGVTKSASVLLRPTTLLSLSIAPTAVTGGSPATATVTMDAPSDQLLIISLTSNGSPIIGTSAQVLPGQTTGSATLNTKPVQSFWTGTVTATLRGVSRTATLQVMPAFTLQSLVLDKSIVIAGETPLSGTVVTTAYAPSDTCIALSDNCVSLITPDSVLLSSGARVATFGFSSTPVSSSVQVTVSATLLGVTKTAIVSLRPVNNPGLVSLSISPTYVTGGNPATATVTLDSLSTAITSVVLTSNGSPIIGTTVQVAPGQYCGSATLNTRTVQSFWTGTVTATLDGTTRTATLQVMPAFGLQSLVLDKSIIIAGETALNGTVITTAYAPVDTSVGLSTDTVNLIVPDSVTVLAGTRVAISSISSVAVSTVTPGTVSASLMGVTRTASVTLSPAPVLVGFTVSPEVVTGGNSINGTVTLSLLAPTGGAIVALSDNTTTINTPSSVTVAGASLSGSFVCTTVPVTTRFRRQITATYRGVTLVRDVTMQP